jgi:4'-phosphopantetheinyl transferase
VINLWLLDTHAIGVISLALLEILEPSEVKKASQLRPAEQRRFLLGRIALRKALSDATGEEPRSWRFKTDELGKTRLLNSNIEFSVTHSGTALGIAVSTAGKVGVDLETVRESKIFPEDQFSENEKSYLKRQSNAERSSEMLKIWTRKEAYSKFLGRGLHMDFSKIDMIAWPPVEHELELETQEVLINKRGYFMSLASQKAGSPINIRSSNLFSCDNN